jgi:hypothetical protein
VQVIKDARNRLAGQYGPKAVAFEFAQGEGGDRGIVKRCLTSWVSWAPPLVHAESSVVATQPPTRCAAHCSVASVPRQSHFSLTAGAR